MTRCTHCRQPIDGEYERIDAGCTLGTWTLRPVRITRDVNLHGDCLGPWFAEHYPWLVKVTTHAA